MTGTAAQGLKRTSLYATHVAAGARMVEFAGWEMPVQYRGIIEEHQAVRTRAGLFDVSHMGEVEVVGPGAIETIQRLVPNDAGRLAVGQVLYTPMCNPAGGMLDDLTVFRLGERRCMLVVNAATTAKDFAWIAEHTINAQARDISAETVLLALQGPGAQGILQRVTRTDLASLRYFHAMEDVEVAGVHSLISRTGYTGEDGFEIACAWEAGPKLWAALLEAGRADRLLPVGLGARDTLRLEAGIMLYGNDIDETTTPLEAPLAWTVKWEKGEFIGRAALLQQKERGVDRKLVGFEMLDRAIPRRGYPVCVAGAPVGRVTSGTYGPWMNKGIGMGYLSKAHARPGSLIEVDMRGKLAGARVVRLPFYKRTAA